MVRGARDPEHCSVRLALGGAGPRCNLFRCRRLRGWWPVVKMKEVEDVEREAREAQGRKKRKRRRKGRPEDLEFTDTGGNVYILTVRRAVAKAWLRAGLCPLTASPSPSRGRLRRSLNC